MSAYLKELEAAAAQLAGEATALRAKASLQDLLGNSSSI